MVVLVVVRTSTNLESKTILPTVLSIKTTPSSTPELSNSVNLIESINSKYPLSLLSSFNNNQPQPNNISIESYYKKIKPLKQTNKNLISSQNIHPITTTASINCIEANYLKNHSKTISKKPHNPSINPHPNSIKYNKNQTNLM